MKTVTTTVLAVLMVFLNGRVDAQYEIPDETRFNFFDLELLQAIASSQPGNLLVSPASVKATLGLILEASGGRSAEQIRHALRLPENQGGVQKLFQNYLHAIKSVNAGYKLQLSNRVYLNQDLSPRYEYKHALQNFYHADVDNANFARPEQAAATINRWISNATRGLIPSLVDASSLGYNTKALITNAIYFKGKWKTPFDPSGTTNRCFYVEPEKCVKTNMMMSMDIYPYSYIQELDSYALELPYEGDKYSMLIVLPKTKNGMSQLVRDILHQPIHQIAKTLEKTEVLVSIPRFEIEYFTDLVPTLSSLGIRDVFNSYSNLSGLFQGDSSSFSISNVYHKIRLIVNEEGSEAAAATGLLVVPLMGTTIPKFRADHPFLYFIRDTTDNAILLAGRMSEPDPDEINPRPTTRIRPRPTTTTRRPSKTNAIEIKQDQYVYHSPPTQSVNKVQQAMNDSFVFPTTTSSVQHPNVIASNKPVQEVLPLSIPSSQSGQWPSQNGFNQHEPMRPLQAQNNYNQQESRPLQAQNSYNQQESRPLQAQNSYNQQEQRPQQAQNNYNQQEPVRPLQGQNNYNQQESRPQQAQNNYNQQEPIRPLQAQNNYNQQESRPQQAQNSYNQQESRPQQAQNSHQQESRPQQAQNSHHQQESRPQQAQNNHNQQESRPTQAPSNARHQPVYQQPQYQSDQQVQSNYNSYKEQQSRSNAQDANRRQMNVQALPLSSDYLNIESQSSSYHPSRSDNRVSPVYRADLAPFISVEITRPGFYARQTYDARDNVNYPK